MVCIDGVEIDILRGHIPGDLKECRRENGQRDGYHLT
jgi:hypothetical protein